MALYLQRGMGGPVDLPQAKVYARRAAEKQEAMGMRLLADLLLDEAKASADRDLEQQGYRWLIKAADRGNRGALRKLGDLHAEGRLGFTDETGDPILVQNFEQALGYYEQAATRRDFEACKLLAAAYDDNVLAPIDLAKAYGWTLVAAQLATKSDEIGKLQVRLKEMGERLHPSDLIAGQNLARSILLRMPTEKEDAERSLLKAR
jgi:TPR repeat protein